MTGFAGSKRYLLLIVVGFVALIILIRWPSPQPPPQLIVHESVAADFEALMQETWAQFLLVFSARTDCFGDVFVKAEYDLSHRATYDPKSATVTIRVPATPAMLQGALVHEWAHHLEFHCDAHQELREAFLAAQGLPPDTPWRADDIPANPPASLWATIPSEQYAEATIELVLGQRQIPTNVRVAREAIQIIEEWARP